MKKKCKFHRIDGLHGHVHLHPHIRPVSVSVPPKVIVRRLIGNGIHDGDEITIIPENWLEGLDTTNADENQYEENPWDLTNKISQMNGVITQSVTLASEAVLLGVPTLLVSKAKRGFLDRLLEEGYPLFIAKRSRCFDLSSMACRVTLNRCIGRARLAKHEVRIDRPH